MQNERKITEELTLTAIKDGLYRDRYLVYNRKSTDEPNNQKNSLLYQKLENIRFAQRNLLPIAFMTLPGFSLDGIVSEKHSGFKEDATLNFGKDGTVQYRIERPKFYRLVQFLSEGYFKGIIVLCWDRASRNKGDNTVIEKLIKQGVDFRFALASYDKTSSGALHMDIDGMFAEHHSRVTSEKVSLTFKNQRSKGKCVSKAPVGYLNKGTMDHKPFDSVRAPIITQLFEEYATGMYSLADLARWANSQGLTMPPIRRRRTNEELLAEEEDEVTLKIDAIERPITFQNVHGILSNRFYTGRIRGIDGKFIDSTSHKALVSDALFEQVQYALRRKRVSKHYTRKILYPYRGMLRCGLCNRVYTPYTKKGILYFGARCVEGCSNTNRSLNKTILESHIDDLIQHLIFTDCELLQFDENSCRGMAELERQQKQKEMVLTRQQRKLSEDLAYLKANKLLLLRSGVYTAEGLQHEEETLTNTIQHTIHDEAALGVSAKQTTDGLKKLSELLKSLYFYYKNANPTEKEEYVQKLFSELSFLENTLKIKLKSGLQVLESRFCANGAPTTWISEAGQNYHLLEESTRLLEKLLSARPSLDS